jgi:cytochrome P450
MAVASPAAPVGPRGQFLFGNLLDINRDQLGFLLSCAQTYGDHVELYFGRRRVIVLNNPRDVEEVLVNQQRNFAKGYFYRILEPLLGNGLLTSEGSFWLRQRRLAQPAFHRERIDAYAQTMVAYTHRLLERWSAGAVRDVNADMMQLTLRIVGKTLFDADFESEAADVGQALPQALHELSAQMIGPEFLLPSAVPTPSRFRLRRAVNRLDPLVFGMIARRRADGADRGDLLSALLRVQDEDGSRMTDRQLRDEAMTIVLAGHETTALALGWAWYLLSQNPRAEQRLSAELDDVLQGRAPSQQDVSRLPYTEAVLMETMRLYPPIFGIGRESIADCEINGLPVPGGTNVYIVPYVIQRDPRWFDDPHSFRPERWLDGLARQLPRFAYFPFGGGPRLCIGQAFAMLENMLILSTIAQRWRLRLMPDDPVAMAPALTLRPKHGLRMHLTKREEPTID